MDSIDPSASPRQAAHTGGNGRSQRFVLVHLHLFKNAGSTIEALLEQNFGEHFHRVHAEGDLGVIRGTDLQWILRRDRSIRALSSHHFRYPLPETDDCKLVDICFLRHPLQRVASMHRYLRTLAPASRTIQAAHTSSFPGFLEYLLEYEPFNVANAQTCFLARSGDYYFPPDAQQEADARQKLRDIRFLGTVERFDDSLLAARHFLRPLFPGFRWEYELRNATEGRLSESLVAASTDRMRRTHGEVVRFFLDANQHDLAVWEAANAEIARRKRLVWVPCADSQRLALTPDPAFAGAPSAAG